MEPVQIDPLRYRGLSQDQHPMGEQAQNNFPGGQFPYPSVSFPYPTAGPSSAVPAPAPVYSFFNPWEPVPVPTAPPMDIELQKRIDKLVEYALKNGPQFEALMKDKQKDNPAYAFLLGGDGFAYYRYKLWIAVNPSSSAGLGVTQPSYDPHQPGGQSVPSQLQGFAAPQHFDQYQQVALPADQYHYHQQPYGGASGAFIGSLPPDVLSELSGVLESLTGTKEVIKSAKIWFMQRGAYAGQLAEAMCQHVRLLNDPERQMHVVYLVNDILFHSLQQRTSPTEMDSVALAFRPVLGMMLAHIYHGPSATETNQDRLKKILDFWGSKEVYDKDTMNALEGDMMAGPPPEALAIKGPTGAAPSGAFFSAHWQGQREQSFGTPLPPPAYPAGQFTPTPLPGMFPPPVMSGFAGNPPLEPPPAEHPPYPLFPPGLIPGMVRKMQIGSGVPYSAISPNDIPSSIPPSTKSEAFVLTRVKKFFREVGEANPLAKEDDEVEEEEHDSMGLGSDGSRIPPPLMEVDPETGTLPDGSVENRGLGGGGRLGLGAGDDSEMSQYDDVYSSYRKSRSSNYHTSLSVRAAMKYEVPQTLK